jgi:type IV secretory pathway VirB10-like protein
MPSAKPTRFVTYVILSVWIVCAGVLALLLWPEGGPEDPPPANQVAVQTSEDPAKSPAETPPPPPPPVAEKPPETTPPPPPKEEPRKTSGKTPYPRYAEKRKAVEDKVSGDPTILKSKHGVLPLFRKLSEDTRKVQAKHKKKKTSKVEELLIQAEVYEATHKTVDELYHLLFD